jgi:nucleoid-associated protein YgaU
MAFRSGFMMKRPVLFFSSVALLAVATLGTATYVERSKVTDVVMLPQQQKAAAVELLKEAEKPVVLAQPNKKAIDDGPVLPEFDTVRVEPTGEAVIAGTAAPQTDVKLKLNGVVVGQAKSEADGSFVVIPDAPLARGAGELTLEVAKDGAVVSSQGAVVVDVKKNAPALVATVEPTSPTRVISSDAVGATKDVQLSAVDYDAAGNIVFSGTVKAGQSVRFYVDNALIGEGVADAQGLWSFSGNSTVAPGQHMFRADAVAPGGNVVSRIELPFVREEPSTVAAPAQAQNVGQQAALAAAHNQQLATTSTDVAAERKIVIQPGNNLWRLSREVYGKGRMYTVIFEANRQLLKNPNRIYPGQILTAPKAPN